MKGKPILYLNGNERNFRDHYTISLMTGEPMPKKWQRYIELTTEEKARWDAELKLDEEYRIAESQGFPNGIPGGKMRGNILYTITQREDGEKRKLQEENQQGRFFSPQKTEMQNNNSIIPNNTLIYGQNNVQSPSTFNQKQSTELLYTRQNNLLPMNTGIKKEPAFDVKQANRKIANQLEARSDDREGQDNSMRLIGTSDSMMQRDESLQDNQDVNDMTSEALSDQKVWDAIVEDRRTPKMKNGEIAGVRERAVIRYINLSNGEIVPYGVITSNAVLGSSYNGGTYDDSNDTLDSPSGYRVEESKKRSAISSTSANIRNTTGKISNNNHDTVDGYSGNYNEEILAPVTNNVDEKESFWDMFHKWTGQYGDGGTVPMTPWSNISNPEEVRKLVLELQAYQPILQNAMNEAYGMLPNIAEEAVSLAIARMLPPHLKGTALGLLITYGICQCANKAYNKWDQASGSKGFMILFSNELMVFLQ